ncbi:DUF1294 domain-containing protein [Thalassotalea agarivorans]|uniref:Uncharacterized membrane protein YsdA, DUF1294 family n=1 Tax=Thalassotalea agarivorans TaxID=349064 RepID=A0A1I0FNP0_THASX|nr:DUF1294 domain-containing protein [Thalassotalea agarivorans]SET59123.1 Uncharacterized membrane protein YsdA, DUF1294 family [Thalassotalea agarivorans]
MRAKGTVVRWNDDKAFGFVKPAHGGKDLFLHKNALQTKSRTPKIGESLLYTEGVDKQGRMCILNATYPGELVRPATLPVRRKKTKPASLKAVYLAFSFLIGLMVAAQLDYIGKHLMYWYAGLSFFTFLMYWSDKSKASNGGWRTPEANLHFVALIGGWPGAAIAQQILRHKTSKESFQLSFWFTVIVNIGILCYLLSPYADPSLKQIL